MTNTDNIYRTSPNALAVQKAYAAERKAESRANTLLLVAVLAVCLAGVSATMAMVFRAQRDQRVECGR